MGQLKGLKEFMAGEPKMLKRSAEQARVFKSYNKSNGYNLVTEEVRTWPEFIYGREVYAANHRSRYIEALDHDDTDILLGKLHQAFIAIYLAMISLLAIIMEPSK
jgi:hypothetical protein